MLTWGSYRGYSGPYSKGTVPVPNPGITGTEQRKKVFLLAGTEGCVDNWNGYDSCVISGTPVGLCEAIGTPFGPGLMSKMLIHISTEAKDQNSLKLIYGFYSYFADNGYFIDSQTNRWEHIDHGLIDSRDKLAMMWHGLPTWVQRENPDDYWKQFPNAMGYSMACANEYLKLYQSKEIVGLVIDYCGEFIDRIQASSGMQPYVNTPMSKACFMSFFLNNQPTTKKVFSQVHLDTGKEGDGLAFAVLDLVDKGFGLDVWKHRSKAIRPILKELWL